MTFTNLVIGIITFILLLIILMQISKVTEVLRGARKDQNQAEEESSNLLGSVFFAVGIIGMALIVWSYFLEKNPGTNKFLPEAATALGRSFDHIFYNIFTPPILIVFFITQFLLFYFAYKYRYKKNGKAFYFSHSNRLEIIWTSVPLITMIIFGIVTIPKWVQATSAPSENAMHIRITGMQFKWFMAYPGADNEFGERDVRKYGKITNLLGLVPDDTKGYDDIYVEELYVPVNQEISFDLSALDVIHNFYLPHFRVKMDCVPGVPTRMKIIPDRTTEEMKELTDNPNFEYEIACAELCGNGHWNMRRTIKVVSQEEFDQWLATQTSAKELYYNTILAEQAKQEQELDAHTEHSDHAEDITNHENDEENQHGDSHEEETNGNEDESHSSM